MNYSIIIPHKNIPSLLQRCLDSIPTRADLQVIVVDDNSDPEIVDFEHFPGSDRDDVKLVFTKEGKGAGYARNVGMKYAIGKWLLFADADDFFHDGMLEMLDKWKDSDYQLVFFKTDSVDSGTLKKVESRLKDLDYNDISCLKYQSHVVWGKLFATDLIKHNNILFDEVEICEDVTFSLKTGFFAKQSCVSQDILYCCVYRGSSLTFSHQDKQRLITRINVYFNYNNFCKSQKINQDMNATALVTIRELKFTNRKERFKQFCRYIRQGGTKTLILVLIEKMKLRFGK